MRSTIKYFVITLAAMCIAGCSNLNYVGQHFTPTPPGKGIELFNGRENIPVNKYTIIGKITLESDTIPNKYVVEKDLTAKARAVGGDAVCIVEQRSLKRGAYTTMLEQHGANPGKPDPELLKKYGDPLPLQGEKSSMIVVQIRALVLKDKEAVNKLLNK